MRNLAGLERAAANVEVLAELAAAGITPATAPDPCGEVEAQYTGALHFGTRRIYFRRAWCYWTATCVPWIPAPDCHTINERAGDFGATRYSGPRGTLGAAARAFGFAGGMDRARLESWLRGGVRGVDAYHIDTPDALAGFVAALRELYGEAIGAPPCASEVRCD